MNKLDELMFPISFLHARPAYGRSIDKTAGAWENGEDFYSVFGYFSKRDVPMLKDQGFTHISVTDFQNVSACAVIKL